MIQRTIASLFILNAALYMLPERAGAVESSPAPDSTPFSHGLSWFLPRPLAGQSSVSTMPAVFLQGHEQSIYVVDFYGDGLVFWGVNSSVVARSAAGQGTPITLSLGDIDRIVSRVSLGSLNAATHIRLLPQAILLESITSNSKENDLADVPLLENHMHQIITEHGRSTKRLKGGALQARLASMARSRMQNQR